MHRSPPPPEQALQAARDKAAQLAFGRMLHSHAIPTDWMECTLLRGRTGSGRNGCHVQFVVDQGGPTLLPYARQLEATFLRHLEAIDPDAPQWVLHIVWVLNDAPPAANDAGWMLQRPPAPERRAH